MIPASMDEFEYPTGTLWAARVKEGKECKTAEIEAEEKANAPKGRFMNKKISIGGAGRDGMSHWEGFPATAGWELTIKVDGEGNITGNCANADGRGDDKGEYSEYYTCIALCRAVLGYDLQNLARLLPFVLPSSLPTTSTVVAQGGLPPLTSLIPPPTRGSSIDFTPLTSTCIHTFTHTSTTHSYTPSCTHTHTHTHTIYTEFSGVWTVEDQEAGIMPEIKAVFIGGGSKGNVNTYSGTINFETMTFEGRLACVEGNFAGAKVASGEWRAKSGEKSGKKRREAQREEQERSEEW